MRITHVPARRTVGWRAVLVKAGTAIALGLADIEALSSGQSMKPLDSHPYFADAKVAAFVDDVQRGNLQRVTAALAAGMDPNARGKDGFRPIHFVFPAPTADVTRTLLAAGADANARVASGNTPLHFAVRMPNPAFTEALLAARGDPNAIGANQKPVIHEAISSHEPRNLELLAKAGADLNAEWAFSRPVQAAIAMLQWDMATALLKLGADAQASNRRGETVAQTYCEVLGRLQPTATNRRSVVGTAEALRMGGAKLGCEDRVAVFR